MSTVKSSVLSKLTVKLKYSLTYNILLSVVNYDTVSHLREAYESWMSSSIMHMNGISLMFPTIFLSYIYLMMQFADDSTLFLILFSAWNSLFVGSPICMIVVLYYSSGNDSFIRFNNNSANSFDEAK